MSEGDLNSPRIACHGTAREALRTLSRRRTAAHVTGMQVRPGYVGASITRSIRGHTHRSDPGQRLAALAGAWLETNLEPL
ncbi:MAG: hypothetical protein WKG07_40635 [Hymenobacter sp.]